MTERDVRIVELTLRRPDSDGTEVASLVNLGNMTHLHPVQGGQAVLTRVYFLDGSHIDVKESLADVARMLGITPRRPQRLRWGDLGSHSNPTRALRGGSPGPTSGAQRESPGRSPQENANGLRAADPDDKSEE